MSIFAFICPYQLLTLKKKVTFRQLFSRPGPCDPYAYARSENMRVLVKMCAHTFMLLRTCFTWNFTIVHYYVMTSYLEFQKDSRFCCWDIRKVTLNMHTRGMNASAKVRHTRMHVFASCARICAQIFSKFFWILAKCCVAFLPLLIYRYQICIRYIRSILHVYLRYISYISQAYLRSISTISQPYFGHMSGIFYKYLKHI